MGMVEGRRGLSFVGSGRLVPRLRHEPKRGRELTSYTYLNSAVFGCTGCVQVSAHQDTTGEQISECW